MHHAKTNSSRQAFLASGAGAFASIAVVRAPARAATYQWKCGDGPSANHPLNIYLNHAFAKIKAETNGDFEIRLFSDSALGTSPAMVNQLRLGALEMMANGNEGLDFVAINAMGSIPFAFANAQAAYRAWDGDFGAMVRKEFDAKGLFVFERVYEGGFREMATTLKAVRTVDDMQGLKMRVIVSKLFLDLFKSLGAAPTPIPYAEVYTALQSHIVDGMENPLSGIDELKFYEVTKYVTMTNHVYAWFTVEVNKERWNGLPKKYQDIARKHINGEALNERVAYLNNDKGLRDKLTKTGLQFFDVDINGFRNKLKGADFYSRWKTEWGQSAWAQLERYVGALG